MQSPKKPLATTALALVGLSCLLVIAILFLAPVSDARRQTAPPAQTKATKRPRAEIVPGEVLVRFKEDKTLEGSVQLTVPTKGRGTSRLDGAPELVALRVDRFEGSNLVRGLRLAHSAAADTWKAIAALRSRADVQYAEPNYLRHADNTPNDPSFGSLYGMTKIAAPQAWDLTTGSNSIVVGVVDEGIQLDHTDLQANIWTNPSPGSIPGIAGDLHGYDFIGNSGTIPPENHATHVAGTIGAVGNNGVGVVGVNWQSSLMSLRFINEATNSGSDADAIRALNYAKQMRDLWISSNHAQGANVRVLNNSYGGAAFSQSFLDAINALNQSDILFVAAAGNDAGNNDVFPHYPANYASPNVIAVAATDSTDVLANFSDYGSRSVLLGAPGVGILSTVPDNSYSFFSGTSMATPHVVGAAALLLAANPNLTVSQLRWLLAYNGDVVDSLQGKTVTGRRLNAFKSLQALSEGDNTPPGAVSSFQITSQSGRTVNLSWLASGDDGAAGLASLYDISFVDASTNAVFPLTTVTPAAPGALQTATVNVPYRHTTGTIKLREFDNVGNEGTPSTIVVTVPLPSADPYVPGTAPAAVLSTGGTAMTMNCDDCFKTRVLPFSFSFFGTTYSSVTVSSNGNIYFETQPVGEVPSSIGQLSQFRMIAGMWDDLDLRTSRRADADVFVVQPDSTHVIFRWQGVQFGDGINGDPINFEIELNFDGTIKTRYGNGNTNLFPVVGISGGGPEAYTVDSLTSEQGPISLTNAQSSVFTLRSQEPGCPIVLTVNNNGDASDVTPGDNSCATAGAVCTLRAAIEEANAITSCGTVDITLNLSTPSTISLGSALVDINHNININGPGANLLTVQRSRAGGTPNFRIFNIQSGRIVTISGLTMSNGHSSGGSIPADNGGAVLNAGILILSNIRIFSNTSTNGGGIENVGTLTVADSTITGNSSTSGAGISNNGNITLTNSTVSENNATEFGGGISNIGTLSLINTTVSDNHATTHSGGGLQNSGSATLTNSTVSGNTSINGGGLFNGVLATLNLVSTTVSANSSNGDGGGVLNDPNGASNISNSIVADNSAGNGAGPDLSGAFNSQDYNLIGNTLGATFAGPTAHNITNVNAKLGPLAQNGGPTQTHALLSGSPAIDAGNSSLSIDQRGQQRPIDDQAVKNAAGGNASDIGAYESRNLQVNSLADTNDGACSDLSIGNGCTLHEAINAANGQSGPDLITFAPALTANGPATITLLNPLPSFSSDVTIIGSGASLLSVKRSSAAETGFFRIFGTDSVATVSIFGLTIANGHLGSGFGGQPGGGIFNNGSLTLTDCVVSDNTIDSSIGGGGGIYNNTGANLTLTNTTINRNYAEGGGGISNGGTLTITNSMILGNISPRGAGILNSGTATLTNSNVGGNYGGGGGIENQGDLVLINSNLTFNDGYPGGGIFNGGTLSATGSVVSGNYSFGLGGGIYSAGNANLMGTTVSGNTASSNGGGGIYAYGALTLTNSTVSGNFANNSGGGGIYKDGGTLNLTNSTIAGNTAGNGGGGLLNNAGAVSLRNTIVANNTINSGAGPDLNGSFNSQDYNLIGNTSGASFTGTTVHNITNVNALLGPLAINGGPTQTHALLPGSPAIDAGNNAFVSNPPFSGPPFTDQRGGNFSRIADGDGNGTAIVDIGACELQGVVTIDTVNPPAGRTQGGQQITLHGAFTNLSTVMIGGTSASWSYTNGGGDVSSITITTPAHAVGAVQIDLTPTSGGVYSKPNAFAYLPAVFTDDTIVVGQTTAKAQHIIELRQAVDALRAVAGLGLTPWADPALAAGGPIKAIHILDLRTYLDDAATRLGYGTLPYTDPGLTSGFMIKRIHIEELRQRIRTIAG